MYHYKKIGSRVWINDLSELPFVY